MAETLPLRYVAVNTQSGGTAGVFLTQVIASDWAETANRMLRERTGAGATYHVMTVQRRTDGTGEYTWHGTTYQVTLP